MAPCFVAWNGLVKLCQAAVDEGAVPGMVVLVGQSGRTRFHRAFGHRQIMPALRPATPDTVYDLASLTKALVTSVLVMQAVDAGHFRLDDPLIPGAKSGPTIRQALCHAAGFPPFLPLYEHARSRTDVVRFAAGVTNIYPPGTRSVYSDLDFLLLGDRLEQATGCRLDELARTSLFRPLGIRGLDFDVSSLRADHPIAPTEVCPVRGRLLEGQVHDLNAYAMEGVSGHAGLFGSATGVASIAYALVAAYQGRRLKEAAPTSTATIRRFWASADVPGSSWRLGWDGPAADDSLAGTRISRRAVGHLGFTGCSLWIEPDEETVVVMLSNRVHPKVSHNPGFRALRPAVMDAALAALAKDS